MFVAWTKPNELRAARTSQQDFSLLRFHLCSLCSGKFVRACATSPGCALAHPDLVVAVLVAVLAQRHDELLQTQVPVVVHIRLAEERLKVEAFQ